MQYNKHLFGNPVSRFFHISRFKWLRSSIEKYAPACEDVLELGCFDGRSYDYIARKPKYYRGLDANWAGALDATQARFSESPDVVFKYSNSIDDFRKEAPFDVFICMETMEHIDPRQLPTYISTIAEKLDGTAFITVPNETGAVFALKNAAKMALGSSRPYSYRDFVNHVRGRTWKISNPKGGGHRGFSYDYLLKILAIYFDLISVEGLPFRGMPLSMNTTIAIVARSR